jgi:hypothetical protein
MKLRKTDGVELHLTPKIKSALLANGDADAGWVEALNSFNYWKNHDVHSNNFILRVWFQHVLR